MLLTSETRVRVLNLDSRFSHFLVITHHRLQRQPHPQDNMGKVHGSLARAGKVKSQTPKVDKQEKKKTPKGRAKKRILYNRRFVNVTTLPGGKRRM
ncbi:ribosomal protein S30-domain-containing protein [Gymnopilus junonius]|uniref:Ribosomal protein S30-domain-containing protein n=1 Tax=Gymnopilus junonius TaxID=109634 RepID=A0A9P5NSS9_GYMJU|nr:ribosomal protein S30-domain-containing protein [Gymnopilus junonius]